MGQLLRVATAYAERGWRVVPIPYREKGPKVPAWQKLRLGVADLPRYFNGSPQNLGVLLGEPSGWLVDVDLDCAEAIALSDDFLPPASAFGRASARGSHRLFLCPSVSSVRFPDPAGNDAEKGTLVEVRSTGGQTVFPPSVHCGGEPIEWENKTPPAEIKAHDLTERVTRLAVASLLVRRHWARAEAVLVARAGVASLLAHVRHEVEGLKGGAAFLNSVRRGLRIEAGAEPQVEAKRAEGGRPGDDYNTKADWPAILEPHGWVNVGVRGESIRWRRPGKQGPGCSATTGYCGDLLHVFTSGAPPFEADGTYSKFAAFTLLNHSGDSAAAARDLAAKGYGSAPAPAGQAPQSGPRKLKLIAYQDVRLDYSKPQLVDGWLDHSSLALFYGPSNAGKSFLVLDLSFHVATGRSWYGNRVDQGAVVYIAGESPGSILRRIDAIRTHYRCQSCPLFVVPEAVNLVRRDGDLPALIGAVQSASQGQPVRMIVLDTVATALGGADENSFEGMGAFISSLGALRDQTGAAIVGVHHIGKDVTKGARGHSSLKCAVDTLVELRVEDDVRLAVVEKQRDRETGQRIGFDLHPVQVGTGPNGESIEVPIVLHLDPGDIRRALEGRALEIYEVLERMLPLHPGGVPLDIWRTEWFQSSRGLTGRSHYGTFKRSLRGLAGWVTVMNGRAVMTARSDGRENREPDPAESSPVSSRYESASDERVTAVTTSHHSPHDVTRCVQSSQSSPHFSRGDDVVTHRAQQSDDETEEPSSRAVYHPPF